MKTKLVRNTQLEYYAQYYEMNLIVEKMGGRIQRRGKQLADLFEAYVGAVYLELEPEQVNEWLEPLFLATCEEIANQSEYHGEWLSTPR